MSGEREISRRMEKQELTAEALHDESTQARQNDLRCHVGFSAYGTFTHIFLIYKKAYCVLDIVAIACATDFNLCKETTVTIYIRPRGGCYKQAYCPIFVHPASMLRSNWGPSTLRRGTFLLRNPTRRLVQVLLSSLCSPRVWTL